MTGTVPKFQVTLYGNKATVPLKVCLIKFELDFYVFVVTNCSL